MYTAFLRPCFSDIFFVRKFFGVHVSTVINTARLQHWFASLIIIRVRIADIAIITEIVVAHSIEGKPFVVLKPSKSSRHIAKPVLPMKTGKSSGHIAKPVLPIVASIVRASLGALFLDRLDATIDVSKLVEIPLAVWACFGNRCRRGINGV